MQTLLIRCRDGAEVSYRVELLPAPPGALALRLEKEAPGDDPAETEYVLRLSPSGSSCTCRGWQKWRRPCKHLLKILEQLRRPQPGPRLLLPGRKT